MRRRSIVPDAHRRHDGAGADRARARRWRPGDPGRAQQRPRAMGRRRRCAPAAPRRRPGMPGKMLECGAEPTVPKEPDNIFLRVYDDHMICEPPNPIRRSTPLAVANFALHENSSPIHHVEPGGLLDTSACVFEAVNDRAVKISGMTWTPAETYTIKLEGVEARRLSGRSASAAPGTRCLIGQIDSLSGNAPDQGGRKGRRRSACPPSDYNMVVRTYGKDGVMAGWEPKTEDHLARIRLRRRSDRQDAGHRQCRAGDGADLDAACRLPRPALQGRQHGLPVSARPTSSSGRCIRFSIFHVVAPKDPYEMFPIEYETV